MKVLFLDVDGVLNCDATTDRCETGERGVDEDKCALIRKIITETGAKIVVSSTWRKRSEWLRHLFKRLGRKMRDEMEGCTPVLDSRRPSGIWSATTRGEEIMAFVAKNPHIKKFVILDDADDMDPLRADLVQTDGRVGLTPEIAEKVIDRLGKITCAAP